MRGLERVVGVGLLLGPLAYALTLTAAAPEVEVIVVERAPALAPSGPVVPDPEPQRRVEPEITVEPEPAPVVAEAVPFDDRLQFAFVTSAGLVLDARAQASWGTGRLRAHRGPGQYRAAKQADPAAIPAALWAQRGRTFDLYGPEGRVCTARLGELSILAQHNGPSLYDVFADESESLDYDSFDEKAHSAKEIRAQVWRYADGESWLVGEVVGDSSCAGALWARDSALPAVDVLRPSDAPSALTRRRAAEFIASEQYAALQRDHEKWLGDLEPESRPHDEEWATLSRDNPVAVRTWTDVSDAARLTELQFGFAAWCGDGFDSKVSLVDAVVDQGFQRTSYDVGAVAVFDADHDGVYERLYAEEDGGGLALASETPALQVYCSVPATHVCPC